MLATRNAAVFDGTYKPRSSIRAVLLSEYAERFIDTKRTELASWSAYRGALRNHLVPHFKRKHLHEITAGDCEDYRRHRLGEGAAPATIRNELRYLQSVYAEARKHELCSNDPVAGVSFKGIRNSPEHAPSGDDIGKLLEAVKSEPPESMLRPLFFVLLTTGMRLQTALCLRWEHVDFERGCLGSIQKGGSWVWPPMHPELAKELRLWEPISKGMDEHGWVFPSLDRPGPFSQTGVHKRWKKLLERAGVSGITRHDMRRFLVTRMRAAGADDGAIKRVSGHASTAMVDRYDKRGTDDVRALAAAAIDLKSISNVAEKERSKKIGR